MPTGSGGGPPPALEWLAESDPVQLPWMLPKQAAGRTGAEREAIECSGPEGMGLRSKAGQQVGSGNSLGEFAPAAPPAMLSPSEQWLTTDEVSVPLIAKPCSERKSSVDPQWSHPYAHTDWI